MSDPPEFTPGKAVERWLERERLDKAEQTVIGYRGQLKLFVEYCQRENIDRLGDVTPWDIQEYETVRRGEDIATVTLRNELLTLRQFLKHYVSLGVVDEHVPESIELPKVPREEQTTDTILETEAAQNLLRVFREGTTDRFGRGHAFLELAWYTGARMGAIRGLDIDDVDFTEGYVQFRHRPEEDTPLKNTYDGERAVGISDDVVTALQDYIVEERPDVTDDYGRKPLFATIYGRASLTTVRKAAYNATIPCRYGNCPHGKVPRPASGRFGRPPRSARRRDRRIRSGRVRSPGS